MIWLAFLLACTPPEAEVELSIEAITARVRPDVSRADVWALAVRDALRAAGQPVDPSHVCQVLAVIEQESGYESDPAVPGLAGMVEAGLEAEVSQRLGLLGPSAMATLLDVEPEGSERTFRQRLREVTTERDVDELFQALVAHHEGKAPAVAKAVRLVAPRLQERLNPITTAGSMQVKVAYALEHPVSKGRSPDAVRASMYEVDGGVLYGTLRLFDTADYAEPLHRFADFNAGPYASRNAALQDQLASLTGRELAADGDLLVYDRRGRAVREQVGESHGAAMAYAVSRGLDPEHVARELTLEKSSELEQTSIWVSIQSDWSAVHGHAPPPYARVPSVTLDSPKLRGTWTTALFAERVQRRFEACLARG